MKNKSLRGDRVTRKAEGSAAPCTSGRNGVALLETAERGRKSRELSLEVPSDMRDNRGVINGFAQRSQ